MNEILEIVFFANIITIIIAFMLNYRSDHGKPFEHMDILLIIIGILTATASVIATIIYH